jgi:hypothetical protein
MPQMELEQYEPQSNEDLLDAIRGTLDPVYQARVPSATRAGLSAVMNAMDNYSPAMNAFMDQLVNLIGAQIVRYQSWTNPLGVYKQGLLESGESIEEVALGLLRAHVYKPESDPTLKELFGQEKPPAQSVFHKVNRQEWYKVSINESQLERAFLNPGGLSRFVMGMMAQLNTSDNNDEFVMTANTLRRYYDAGGFFKMASPDINNITADTSDAKQFLRLVRAQSGTLQYISSKYNARHVPMATEKSDLMLITTPTAKATIDVEGLSAAFNQDKATIGDRITEIPDEYIDIPGFQGILTTKRFWVLADKLMRMATIQNPVGLFNNYIWHHQEVISASPFENAILFTSKEASTIIVNDYIVTGINPYTLTDLADGSTVTVTNGTATVIRGHAYEVATSAITQPANGPKDAVALTLTGGQSNLTHVNQYGLLVIGINDPATKVTVHGVSTDDGEIQADLVLTVTGELVQGSVGLSVDTNTSQIANTTAPEITPENGGAVGTVLTTTLGEWDTDDLTFAFTWNRDGAPITGATARTYTTVTADGGHKITSTVTPSRTGYTLAAPATSDPVNITTGS